MGFENHFTCHSFRNLNWTSFEYLVNKFDPLSQDSELNNNQDSEESDIPTQDQNNDLSSKQNIQLKEENNINDKLFDYYNETSIEDDEVNLYINQFRHLVAHRSDQVSDYLLCGYALNDMN